MFQDKKANGKSITMKLKSDKTYINRRTGVKIS